MRHWLVERKRDVFEDVGAEWFDIRDGALWFYQRGLDPVASCAYIVAAGEWITVVPNHEDDA